MFDGSRLRGLMAAQGVSQSELARRVGVSQTTIAKLVLGKGYGSRYLHRIARELATTPAYLAGETDDPHENAPASPPPPTVQHVMLAVALPSETALARMFAGLLRPFELDREDELARTLARQLPKGLRQLEGRLIEAPMDDLEFEASAAVANDHPARRRAQRT